MQVKGYICHRKMAHEVKNHSIASGLGISPAFRKLCRVLVYDRRASGQFNDVTMLRELAFGSKVSEIVRAGLLKADSTDRPDL